MQVGTDVDLFPISKAYLKFPGGLHQDTPQRWHTRGVWSRATGRKVFLWTKQIGGRVMTSLEAYHRFIADLGE
jgi:hypothetical protein